MEPYQNDPWIAGKEPHAAKQVFGRVGLALFVTALLSHGISLCLVLLATWLQGNGTDLYETEWFIWVASFCPLYLVGLPVGILMMRKVPISTAESTRLKFGSWLTFLLMCIPLMYGGNLIGTLLSSLFSSGSASNPLTGYVMSDSWLKVLVVVILAPLLEELLFRKQLIDRLAPYGEKTAVLFSGLTFGLFHMNLYQFFYAFLLGMLFAYVYLRTRKLRYNVSLHMVINFIGSVVAPAMLSGLDSDVLSQMQSGTIDEATMASVLPQLGGLIIFGFVIIVLAIVGIVLLIKKLPKRVYLPAALELPKETRFRTVFCNCGVILFAVFCIGMCVYTLIAA